jgi:GTP pyrophosphokinase
MENNKKENRFNVGLLKFSWEREADEKRMVLREYKAMMSHAKAVSWGQKGKIRKAFEMAATAHDGMRRKSGEPYIMHPLAVARILVEEVDLDDPNSIICALLHDTVEDTDVTLDDIEKEFGVECREIVDGLTKINSKGVSDENISEQAENFRKILLTISHDIRVVIIKLADRLHNMRTLGAKKRTSALKIASETLFLYAPLAHRLGLYSIKTDLENLALKHSQPELYEDIDRRMAKFRGMEEKYIQNFVKEIKKQLKPLDLKFKIKYRFKTVYSVYKKMQRQGVPFEQVYDLFAIRAIVKSKPEREQSDCWQVYSSISNKFPPLPKRLRDWVTHPKENGYESLHMTVIGPQGRWVEVQIRTERMDRIAEKGIAAHWKYKENGEQYEEELSNWIERVRDTLENPSINALDAVKEFRENLQPHNLYVFSPMGELFRVPTGASVLDFAYKIHSDIGDKAIGGKVNNEVVKLDYELKSGDQVEVLTSRLIQVQDDWEHMVKTAHARKHIRRSLVQQKKLAMEKGIEMYKRGLLKYSEEDSADDQKLMRELLTFMKYASREEFLLALGSKKIDASRIKEFIDLKKEGIAIEEAAIEEWEKKIRKRELQYKELGFNIDELVLTSGQQVDKFKLATCCKPVRGDDILGILRGGELEIHRPSCPTAISLMSSFGRNIIQVRWTEHSNQIDFLASIKVVGIDRKGMLSDLIHVITDIMKINISKVSIESQDRMFEGLFNVYIANTEELDRLLLRLGKVSGVVSINRTGSDFVPFQKKEN